MNLETLLDKTHQNIKKRLSQKNQILLKLDKLIWLQVMIHIYFNSRQRVYELISYTNRTLEDFAESGLPENVQQMRFEHYIKKTERKTEIKTLDALQEISKTRKIIIKKQKNIPNLHIEKSFQRDEEYKFLNYIKGLVNDLVGTYNKKRNSIDKENKDASYLCLDEEDSILVLEQYLEKEIAKYKKLLQIKAKEVQHQLDNEKKDINLIKKKFARSIINIQHRQ